MTEQEAEKAWDEYQVDHMFDLSDDYKERFIAGFVAGQKSEDNRVLDEAVKRVLELNVKSKTETTFKLKTIETLNSLKEEQG